jgi:CRP-like cAMP-binding protein
MNSHFAEFQPDVEPLGKVREFVNEFIAAVETGSLLEGFSRRETLLLSGYLECFGVPRHSTVLREGDDGDFLAILITGAAVITKLHEGSDKMVCAIGPGDMIGEMSMIDGQKRSANCITTVPSDFAVLTHDRFKALLADHPRLSNKLLLALLHTTTARLRLATKEMLPGLADFGFL